MIVRCVFGCGAKSGDVKSLLWACPKCLVAVVREELD